MIRRARGRRDDVGSWRSRGETMALIVVDQTIGITPFIGVTCNLMAGAFGNVGCRVSAAALAHVIPV